MANEELEIEINKEGKVTIRTIGIKGEKCLDVAEMLAKIIGEEKTRSLTQEYYEQSQEHSNSNHTDIQQRYT